MVLLILVIKIITMIFLKPARRVGSDIIALVHVITKEAHVFSN